MTRYAQMTQNRKFAFFWQFHKKELSDEVDFLPADKHKRLLQIDRMISVGIVKHSQSSQNSKYEMSLQYLKKEIKDKVDFLHADKHQSFYTLGIRVSCKVNIISINGHDQAFSNYSK